jgi:hypothetical protein
MQLAVLSVGDQERNRNAENVKWSSSTNAVQNQTPLQQAEKSICTVITIKLNRQCETESSLCTRTEDLIFHHYPVPLYYAILTVVIKQHKRLPLLRPVMKPPCFPINVVSQHRLFYHTVFKYILTFKACTLSEVMIWCYLLRVIMCIYVLIKELCVKTIAFLL